MKKYVILLIALLYYTLSVAQDYSFDHFETIKNLNKDVDGNIFLVTDYSICKFTGSENKDDCFYVDEKIDNSLVLSKEYFFISHDKTLKVYRDFEIVNELVAEESITKLAFLNSHLVIGTSGAGAYSYSNQTIVHFLKDVFVNDIVSNDDKLYVITDNELLVFDKNLKPITTKSFNTILEKIVILENSIAILTHTSDIIFLTKGFEVEKIYKPHDFQIENLVQIGTDLIAINKTGILKWHNEDFELIKTTANTPTSSIASQSVVATAFNNQVNLYNTLTNTYDIDNTFSIFAEGDRFWLGREGEIGLFHKGRIIKIIKLPSQYNSTFVSSLVVFNDKIYAGTMGSGILLFDKKTGEYEGQLKFESRSKTHQNVIQMDIKHNLLWIGYLNGLEVLDVNTNQLISDYTPLLKNNYLYQFYIIDDNNFFLCTSNSGLIHQKEGTTTSYLDGKTIYGIEKSNSDYILSVEEEGLYKLNDTLERLSDKVYLNSNNIYNMLSTNKTMLVGHKNGVDVVHKIENEADYLTYPKNLGQPQLNSKAIGTTKILMAFENTIVEFDKSLLNSNQRRQLKLDKPLLFNKPIDSLQSSYAHNENTWTFNYAETNYLYPEDIYYKYRLKPIENDWISTTQQSITYYNLPPGDYNFEVSSGGHRNYIPQNVFSYRIKILKPLWENPLFWLMVFIVLVVLVYLLIKYREKQIKKQETLKNIQLEFEYQRLKDQINPHFLFNSFNSLIGVVEENPKQGIQILEKLSDLYRSILNHEKSEIIPLDEELELAKSYFEIHKLRFQNLINLHLTEIKNPKHKFVIPFSLQLLVENAIKHNVINSKHKLDIHIFEEGEFLVIKNTLNEKKHNSSSLGLGLKNMSNRHKMRLNKLPIFEKNQEFFIVKIPFIHE